MKQQPYRGKHTLIRTLATIVRILLSCHKSCCNIDGCMNNAVGLAMTTVIAEQHIVRPSIMFTIVS